MMTNTPSELVDVYTSFNGLNRLKSGASRQTPEAKREVARQFEAMFLQMMLKSMRQTVGKGPLDSSQTEMAQSLYDQQLALQLSRQGAIGIGDLVLRQIDPPSAHHPASKPATATARTFPVPARHPGERAPTIASADKPTPTAQSLALAAARFDQTAEADNRQANIALYLLNKTPAPQPIAAAPSRRLDGTRRTFVRQLRPAAEQAAEQLGVDPKAILAIAALETGWGRHVMRTADGHSSHNLFGIKATRQWRREHTVASTLEFRNGAMRREKQPFRVYDNPAESVLDFAAFIRGNPRYRAALRHAADPERFIDELHKAGYATDPDYARKVKRVMQTVEREIQESWQVADNR